MDKTGLREALDKHCENENIEGACKDFMVQHTLFEVVDGEWYMNCTIPYTCDEGLYEIDVEECDPEHMDVFVASWKGNYDSFTFCDPFDPTDPPTEDDSVCAHELYDEFKPKNFRGEVFTRGGYSGWNYFGLALPCSAK